MKAYKGILMLMAAEFCFAGATVFAKFITNKSEISALEITFFRFFFGMGISYWALKRSSVSFIPHRRKYVIWRGILNTIAVILFFTSVKYSTVTNANMLNMTYPVFIFSIAALSGIEKITFNRLTFLILSILGIYLVIQPNFNHILKGDLIGLASGIVGGASVLALRKARETESTFLILFYLMTIGTIINGILLIPVFTVPSSSEAVLISASALFGVAGQAFITYGYKYIEASKGSIISSSRIIFAVLFGVIIFNDRLNFRLIIGAILILYTITSLTWIESKQLNKKS